MDEERTIEDLVGVTVQETCARYCVSRSPLVLLGWYARHIALILVCQHLCVKRVATN